MRTHGEEPQEGVMTQQEGKTKRPLSRKTTKQEVQESYAESLAQVEERKEAQLSGEKKAQERKIKEAVDVAESLSAEGAMKRIGDLKFEIGRTLTQISDWLEDEVSKYEKIKRAIQAKEGELKDLFEIEMAGGTLAALIEAQNQKRQQFETEMALRKEELVQEIEAARARWDRERKEHEAAWKEMLASEQKRREREKEEFSYGFGREQQLAKDKFEDEKLGLEKEVQLTKERMERESAEREKVLAEREKQSNDLQARVNGFPQELDAALGRAVKETSERIRLEAKNKEELLKKEFEGDKNVFATKIESLETTVKEQSERIARLSQQLEQSYQKVQDIAVKAIEGSSESKSLATLQHLIAEQTRKQTQEK
jgi:hypothetical protein